MYKKGSVKTKRFLTSEKKATKKEKEEKKKAIKNSQRYIE